MADLTVDERHDLLDRSRKLEAAAEALERGLGAFDALPAATKQKLRDQGFVKLGAQIVEEMRAEVEELRAPLIADGRDPSSGQLLDPLEARRRRASNHGWKPSRHPELDEEFYRRVRDWPNGARLHLKRFNDNGDHQTAHIEVAIEYAERGTVFKMHILPGARDRRGTGADSMVTADELLADRWEVD